MPTFSIYRVVLRDIINGVVTTSHVGLPVLPDGAQHDAGVLLGVIASNIGKPMAELQLQDRSTVIHDVFLPMLADLKDKSVWVATPIDSPASAVYESEELAEAGAEEATDIRELIVIRKVNV